MLLLLIVISIHSVHSQGVIFPGQGSVDVNACETTEGRGTCVDIQECPPVLEAVQTNLRFAQSRTKLCRRASSSRLLKVCCLASERIRSDPLPKDCGHTGIFRITGGDEALLAEYPWMAALFYQSNPNERPSFGCGGSLISSRYVLTAAHCVDPELLSGYNLTIVRLGEHTLSTAVDVEVHPETGVTRTAPPVQDMPVERIISHPDYLRTRVRVHNDIALIRLKSEPQLSEFVQPICLPLNREELGNATFNQALLHVTGWGNTRPDDRTSDADVLQKLKVPPVTLDNCRRIYGQNAIEDYHICAGGEEGKDSCRGDSGGPLMLPQSSGTFTLVGVVSFGPGFCGTEGVPGVYSSVAQFLPWILDNLEP